MPTPIIQEESMDDSVIRRLAEKLGISTDEARELRDVCVCRWPEHLRQKLVTAGVAEYLCPTYRHN